MLRKMITYLLIICMLIPPASALEGERVMLSGAIESTDFSEKLFWTLTRDGTLTISGKGAQAVWSWEDMGIELPVKRLVVGEGVTELSDSAFAGCTRLEQVQLPASLKTIGGYAFQGCTSLNQIRIPEGMKTLGEGAFSGCTALRQVWLADSLEWVGEDAFSGTPWLDSQEDFISSEHTVLRYIGTGASVTIPEGVTAIGRDCFRGCDGVKSISIPESVTRIGRDAFTGTSWLDRQGLFPTVNGILLAYRGSEEEVTIPDSVREIAPGAFQGNEILWKLYLPERCQVIGESAFSDCTYLRNVQMPSQMERIGAQAFANCSNLREIILPEGLTCIENGTFWACRRLGTVTLPESLKVIGDWAFEQCDKLTTLELPEGLTTIGKGAFYDTAGITQIHLPASAVNVSADTFMKTFGLERITVDENHPAFSAMDGVLYSKDEKTLICCPSGRQKDLTIPEGVEVIGSNAFYYNVRTQRVMIADSVERIEAHAFLFSGISAIRIGDESSLTYVGDYAFGQCVSIQSLNLPDSVTYLGRGAFSNCYEMTSITIPEGVTRIYGPVAPLTNVSEVTIHPGVVWIAEDAFPIFEDEPVTIIGQTGSAAERFAMKHDLGFEVMDGADTAAQTAR